MGGQFRKLVGRSAVVACLSALMALALILAACGGVAESTEAPESTEAAPEPTEVEVTVVETVVVEPTEAPPTKPPEAEEPTQEPAPEPTEVLPPTPISPGAAVQEELERLAAGRIAYNPPAEMTVDQTERVEVRITMDEVAALTEGLKGAGAPVVESIPVGCFMRVRLVGDAFEIMALSSEEQIVPAHGFTEWAWDVTPTESGERNLCLIVTALVRAPGAEGQKDLPIIERRIRVKVKLGSVFASFFRANRSWIFPAVLVPLSVAFGRWCWQWQKRRNQPGDPGGGEDSAQT